MTGPDVRKPPPETSPEILAGAPGCPPPWRLWAPPRQLVPLLFSVPHSGDYYPPDLLAASRLGPLALRRSEDCFVDALFAAAPAVGAPLLAATHARAYVDCNRAPDDLDPAMFSRPPRPAPRRCPGRAADGLGVIPAIVAPGLTIYRHPLPYGAATARIARLHRPYHDKLSQLVATTGQRFGVALLVDCHSMPAEPGTDRRGADFVIGDCHGASCHPLVGETLCRALQRMGYSVHRNTPYAGGYITSRYGRPRAGVHAVQIEIRRALYMDEARLVRHRGFARLRRAIGGLLAEMATIDLPAVAKTPRQDKKRPLRQSEVAQV